MDLCVLQHAVQVLPLEPEACSSPGAHSPQAPCLLSTTVPCLGLCRCHHGAVSKHRLWSTAVMHRPWRIKSIRQLKARWIAWWLQRTVHTEHTRMEPDVLISLWHISCLTVLWAAMRWCWEWGQERSTQTEQQEEQNSVPIKRAHCFKNRKQAIVYRIRSRLSPEPHVCSTLQQYVHDCMKKKKKVTKKAVKASLIISFCFYQTLRGCKAKVLSGFHHSQSRTTLWVSWGDHSDQVNQNYSNFRGTVIISV